ncbi:MAG: N(4)-(beta-N-acetylglucosaminyl)-L-asparaginase [Ignavibacteriales bacterium]|nr:N(4)-(beta-N-acetylglucosaminyl)-L-asparaginase [Ignavibacteriales bacterium]
MKQNLSRRNFVKGSTLAGLGALLIPQASKTEPTQRKAEVRTAVVIASSNGLRATAKAMEMVQSGSDALDAVVAGVNIIEDDPNDMTVGYGGLPNEDGVVELDASVMHGPTHRCGAVASLRNIKNPSKVARVVMERTDHVLLVGEGALKFARMHGFKEENLLTEEARDMWVKWKENLSTQDDYLPPHSVDVKNIGSKLDEVMQTYGTINCLAKDLKGNISGVTTTSGLSYKIAGRVGDSPIIGAGLYLDNEIGAAGSTGRGEANLTSCNSVMIVEWMGQGKSPEEACLMACKRVVDHTKMKRLLKDDGKPNFNVTFYAINKRGDYGSAAIWSNATFIVHDGVTNSKLDSAYLFKRTEI